MGIGRSKEYSAAQSRSNKLDQVVKSYHKTDSKVVKLLLLGSGESGKSTIFKQMKLLYGNPYPVKERQQMASVVHSTILVNFRELVNVGCQRFTPLANAQLQQELAAVPDEEDTVLDSAVAAVLQRIWDDAGAQQTWAEHRSDFQIQEALGYYAAELPRISQPDYVPTVDDILRSRVKTSGIVDQRWTIENVEFSMVDVGGQRNERKKWINIMDQVTCVIYVVALSEYNQMLYEDETVPRMDEALQLFDETINLEHFRQTSIVLFLNKADLFREKLRTVPVRVAGVRFDDFAGPHEYTNEDEFQRCYDAAVEYFLRMFLSKNQQPEREIYHHVTCATDTSNVKVVFTAVRHTILSNSIKGSGFMS